MWRNLRAVQANFLRLPECFTHPKRTTFILKRKHGVRLNPLGHEFPKRIKRRGYYYEMIEDTNAKPAPPIELVLTSNVPGVGMRGEKVEMNPFAAYRDLLLPKLAVYSSAPEAQLIMKTTQEKQYSSKYAKIIENYLANQPVVVIVSSDTEWTLKPWHVRLALRKNGIIAKEDCINIPKEISGPNDDIENKDFIVYLTVNKSEVFPLRCRIYHWSTSDPSLNQKSFDINSPSDVLFPEQKEKIDSILRVEEEIRRNQMMKGAPTQKKKTKH